MNSRRAPSERQIQANINNKTRTWPTTATTLPQLPQYFSGCCGGSLCGGRCQRGNGKNIKNFSYNLSILTNLLFTTRTLVPITSVKLYPNPNTSILYFPSTNLTDWKKQNNQLDILLYALFCSFTLCYCNQWVSGWMVGLAKVQLTKATPTWTWQIKFGLSTSRTISSVTCFADFIPLNLRKWEQLVIVMFYLSSVAESQGTTT